MYIITLVNKKTILVPRNTTFFRNIAAYRQPVLFAMHVLKFLNTIFCPGQVFLLCVKRCLPPLHNYLEIDGIVRRIRKQIDWLLNVFLTLILTLMLCFSVWSNHLIPCPTFLLTSALLCMFCSIVTCNMHCKQHKLSRWALFALRAKEKH